LEIITHEGIICQLKFLEKIVGKSLFLQIFLTNLQKKFHVIWEFLVVQQSSLKTFQVFFILLKIYIIPLKRNNTNNKIKLIIIQI